MVCGVMTQIKSGGILAAAGRNVKL